MEQKSGLELKILAKAKATAAEILKKAQDQSKALWEARRAEGEAALSQALEQAKGKGEMIRREYEASGHLESKLLLLKKKDEIVAQAVSQAWEQLKVRVKRDDYRDTLTKLIQEAMVALGLKDAIVALGANEKQILGGNLSEVAKVLSSRLGNSVQLSLAPESLNSLGGVRVTDTKSHLLYDNTWDARLERIRPELAIEITEILFSAGEVKQAATLLHK